MVGKTFISTLLTLYTYTASMYMESWGPSSLARTMIDLRVDVELQDNLVVVVPNIEGDGYILHSIRI